MEYHVTPAAAASKTTMPAQILLFTCSPVYQYHQEYSKTRTMILWAGGEHAVTNCTRQHTGIGRLSGMGPNIRSGVGEAGGSAGTQWPGQDHDRNAERRSGLQRSPPDSLSVRGPHGVPGLGLRASSGSK